MLMNVQLLSTSANMPAKILLDPFYVSALKVLRRSAKMNVEVRIISCSLFTNSNVPI